jgi:peptidoglycan/xylan/chitin deacetylase (PgdA/CDA1 family)
MDWLVKRCKPISADALQHLEAGVRHAAVTFDDGFCSAVQTALPELEIRNIPATIFMSSGCLGQHPSWEGVEEAIRNEVVVTAEQLKRVNESPLVSIGSHCMTHSNLVHMDGAQAKEEILESKVQLEAILNSNVRLLSFPFGAYDRSHISCALDAGYERVFTTAPAMITEGIAPTNVIGRVKADPTDWPLEFRLKLQGAYRWLPLAFSIKRTLKCAIRGSRIGRQ